MWALGRGRTANPGPFPTGIAHSFLNPLGYEAPFELSHGCEDREKELPFRRGRVDVLGQASESNRLTLPCLKRP